MSGADATRRCLPPAIRREVYEVTLPAQLPILICDEMSDDKWSGIRKLWRWYLDSIAQTGTMDAAAQDTNVETEGSGRPGKESPGSRIHPSSSDRLSVWIPADARMDND